VLREASLRYGQRPAGRCRGVSRRLSHDVASARPNGHRLVVRDQMRKATQPRARTPTPNRITRSGVVAKTKIHPSNATSAGSG
jgi:hypothetical protein